MLWIFVDVKICSAIFYLIGLSELLPNVKKYHCVCCYRSADFYDSSKRNCLNFVLMVVCRMEVLTVNAVVMVS